jgi:hypothetical protein
MRFWFLVATIFSGLIFIGHNNDLGERITFAVDALRGQNWGEVRTAYAATSLEQMRTTMKELEAEAEQILKKDQHEQDDHDAALLGVETMLGFIPRDKTGCDQAHLLLTQRLSAAIKSDSRSTVSAARQWSDYVRKRYCYEMPQAHTIIK